MGCELVWGGLGRMWGGLGEITQLMRTICSKNTSHSHHICTYSSKCSLNRQKTPPNDQLKITIFGKMYKSHIKTGKHLLKRVLSCDESRERAVVGQAQLKRSLKRPPKRSQHDDAMSMMGGMWWFGLGSKLSTNSTNSKPHSSHNNSIACRSHTNQLLAHKSHEGGFC